MGDGILKQFVKLNKVFIEVCADYHKEMKRVNEIHFCLLKGDQ